jgi:hypothetical protein
VQNRAVHLPQARCRDGRLVKGAKQFRHRSTQLTLNYLQGLARRKPGHSVLCAVGKFINPTRLSLSGVNYSVVALEISLLLIYKNTKQIHVD